MYVEKFSPSCPAGPVSYTHLPALCLVISNPGSNVAAGSGNRSNYRTNDAGTKDGGKGRLNIRPGGQNPLQFRFGGGFAVSAAIFNICLLYTSLAPLIIYKLAVNW